MKSKKQNEAGDINVKIVSVQIAFIAMRPDDTFRSVTDITKKRV